MKPDKMILTAGPSVTDLEMKYVMDAVAHGWNENGGSYLRRFEESFADLIGTKYTMSTSSCTGAMHLSLLALGIGAGDEVLVPELTWVATASTVKYVGAIPIFVDVDKHTWTMDPEKARAAVTPQSRAIMPVHLYGHPAKMDDIMALAKEFNLKVLEDAAPAIGAEFNGQRVGTFGDLGAFSFQGAKMVVTGEGGMLVTDNEDLLARARKYGDHGRSTELGKKFWIDDVGYKYKMSNMQAAFGLAQIERIDELVYKKRQIFNWYNRRLEDIAGLQLNKEASWAKSIYWMSSIYMEGQFPASRDELIAKLKEDMIDTRPVFPRISQYPMWPDCDSPVADHIGNNSINLPSGHQLTEEDVDYICGRIRHHLVRD